MTSVEDPKSTLLNLIKNNIKLTKDKGSPAKVHVSHEWFNGELFKNFDAQITVGLASGSTAEKMNLSGSWMRYRDRYKVTGFSIDKVGVTGKEMRWKIRREIERIIRSKRSSPGGILNRIDIDSVSEGQNTDSKPPYWTVEIIVKTTRYETI